MNTRKTQWFVLFFLATFSLFAQDCNDFILTGSTTSVSCNGGANGQINLNLPCDPNAGGSGANLALNATVSQSSTSGTATADLAIDDNTSGSWYVDYSVAGTSWSFDSYWTADLGAVYNIDEIEIWGRTDCCQNFVDDYYIFLSDQPFTTESVAATQNATGVTTFTQPGPAAAPNTVPIATSGRYVRIQLGSPGLLQLAEVVIKEASSSGCDLTIEWDNGLGNIEDPQNLTAGTYNVTVSNSDGCTATESFVITEPNVLNTTISEAASSGSNTTLNTNTTGGTSPYTYQWNNGATTDNISVTGGNFSVTVTDANNCTATAMYSLTCTTGATCDDGNDCTTNDVFDENCDCVGTMVDSDNDGVCDAEDICLGFDDTQDADGDGTPDGCDSPDCDGFNLSGTTTDVSCNGGTDGSINLTLPCSAGSGGDGENLALNRPVTQSSTLGTGEAELAVDGNTNGKWYVDYSVSSTTWATQPWWEVDLGAIYDLSEIEVWGRTDCCQDFLSNYYILVSEEPFSSTNLNATLAQNEVSDFLEAGPAGAPNTTAINTSGRYVRIQLQGSSLLQLAEVVVKSSGGGSSSCDLTINWDNGLGDVEDPENLSAGIYRVTVTNTEGCSATKAFTVAEPANALTCSASITQQISTNGGNDGQATASATGGTAPYSYVWSSGVNIATATNLSAGNYTVTITDANDCTCIENITLSEPAGCDLTVEAMETQAISTPGGNDGQATAVPQNGSTPYSYVWNTGGTTATLTNLSAGTYSVTVTDADDCIAIRSVSLSAPDCNLNCTATITQAISEPDENDGSITVAVTGGTAPLTYAWNNNANTATITDLAAGSYRVTVTDANNCTCTSSVNLPNPSNNGLTLNCPQNITVFATSNDGATVTWDTPSVITDCTEGDDGECPDDLDDFSYAGEMGDSKYFLSGYKTFWADAKRICEAAGGHLAVIETQEENTFVKNLINQAHFIGLTDETLEGTYKWIDGHTPAFTHFGTYQPNSATKDYVILNNWGNGTWSHATGFVYKFFILEVPCSSDGIELEQTAGLSSGATFPMGTTNVVYEAEDACGNAQTCSFSVTVQQPSSSISLTCPNNITVMQTAPDGADVTWNSPTGTTTCDTGEVTFTQTAGNSSGSRFSIGTTTISYRATDECGAISTCSFTITVTRDDSATLPSGYCDARGEQPWFEWIERFTLGTIDNGPPTNFKEGRGNFILQSTNVARGSTYPFSIKPGFSYLPRTEHFRLWIDLNRDADFDDEGELLYEGSDNQTINSSITIPETAEDGATLLRIAMDREHLPTSCESFTYGEIEDYSVVIGDAEVQPFAARPPAELLTLDLQKEEDHIVLNWLNNTGPVNKDFIIERSVDGLHYTPLTTLNAYDHTGKIQSLDWTDNAPLEGDNFYRIKLLFNDGTTRYSDYRHTRIFHAAPFTIYPNPARQQTLIDLSHHVDKQVEVQIYSQFGVLIEQIKTTDTQLTVPLSAYKNGVYWVYIITEGQRSRGQKLLVMNMY